MMKTMKKTLQKVAMTVTAVLLGFLLTFTAIALENKGSINSFLGAQTFVKEKVDETAETGDTEYYKSDYKKLADLITDAQKMSQTLEAEGAVLLKNTNGALPLQTGGRSVSLFSVSSVDPAYGGRGSAQGSATPGAVITPPVTPKDGLTNAGLSVNDTLLNFYTNNLDKYKRTLKTYLGGEDSINDAPWSDIVAQAGMNDSFTRYGDAAIFMLTRVGGEAADLAITGYSDGTDGNYLKLSPKEQGVLDGLKQKKADGVFKKIIVLFNAAPQIEMAFLNDDAIDAALWIGNPGQTGFNAVGDILTGKTVPSGRISDMYWRSHAANPVLNNFGSFEYTGADNFGLPENPQMFGQNYRKYMVYQEGIYVGYRYAETRYEDKVMKTQNAGDFNYADVVAYPFGYGESYAKFEYGNLKVSKSGARTYKITLDVKNTDTVYTGKEVVQIYLQKPYNGEVEKAAAELVGFVKTNPIAPGKTESVAVEVDEKYFTSYDADTAKTYIVDKGKHYLTAAKNAHDAVNNILAAKGYKTADGMDAEGNPNLVKEFDLKLDTKTYAKSDATEKKITNLFDEADINKYSGKGDNAVKYVSRKDWAGTVKLGRENFVKLAMTKQMADEMLAQDNPAAIAKDDVKYPTYGAQNGLQLIDLRVDSEGNPIAYNAGVWDSFMDQLTWDETAALVSTGLRKTGAVQSVTKPETVDHNGPNGLTEAYANGPNGLAAKTGDPDGKKKPVYYPCSGIVSATFNAPLAKAFGNVLGEEALWAGYSGLYGIAMNIHRTAYGGRNAEYYSEDPVLTGIIATQEVIGLQARGCAAYIKHFALNDQDTHRQGVNIWSNEQALREIYFKPFEMTVIEGGAKNTMASFTRIGTVNCPQSKPLMTDFLRGELGMSGHVVTDMWQIGYKNETLPLFILAGCDIPDGDLDAKKPFDNFKTGYGELAQAMRESAKRILYSTLHGNAMNGYDSNTRIRFIMPDWLIAVTVVDVVVSALFLASLGWIAADFVLSKKKKA